MENFREYLVDLEEKISSFFTLKDLNHDTPKDGYMVVSGYIILDTLFDVLVQYNKVSMLLEYRENFSEQSEIYFNETARKLGFPSNCKIWIKNAPKYSYVSNPENKYKLVRLLSEAKDTSKSAIELKINKSKAIKEHIKTMNVLMHGLKKLCHPQNNEVMRIKALFYTYMLNVYFHPFDIFILNGIETHIRYVSDVFGYMDINNDKQDEITMCNYSHYVYTLLATKENVREIKKRNYIYDVLRESFLIEFKRGLMNYLLDNRCNIFDVAFWEDITNSQYVKGISPKSMVCRILVECEKKYGEYKEKSNIDYINLLKKLNFLDSLDRLNNTAEEKRKAAMNHKEFECSFDTPMSYPNSELNPFTKFHFPDEDQQFWTSGKKYGCPLKLLCLGNAQAAAQIIYAVDKGYITNADKKIIKKLTTHVIFHKNISEEIAHLYAASLQDGTDFFSPLDRLPNMSTDREQIKDIELWIRDTLMNVGKNGMYLLESFHSYAQKYYEIFNSLCCYTKSSSNGYFSMQNCKKNINDGQTDKCHEEFDKIMAELIIEEAKKTFTSTDSCGSSHFLSRFLSEEDSPSYVYVHHCDYDLHRRSDQHGQLD